MKFAILIPALFLTLETLSQTDSARNYRGITIFTEAGGASLGATLNLDKVLFQIGNWHGAARIGFGRYSIEDNRVKFRSIPLGISLFNRSAGKHHTEIGVNISYVRGTSYIFRYPDDVIVSQSVYFIPTLGYRFQRPGGSLFAKLQYSPFIKIKEFEDELIYNRRYDEVVHFGGLAIGYFFGDRILRRGKSAN